MCDCISLCPSATSITSISVTLSSNPSLPVPRPTQIPFKFIQTHRRFSRSLQVTGVTKNPSKLGSEEFQFDDELRFGKREKRRFELDTRGKGVNLKNSDVGSALGSTLSQNQDENSVDSGKATMFPDSGDRKLTDEKEEVVRVRGRDRVEPKREELGEEKGRMELRRGREMMRRSSMVAKQVISIQSALNLGYVSQLWVDTSNWVVLLLEVRSNLLSGEADRFLLENVSQVGDVVLVQDETVMENDFRMVGLETLVGYKVVTPGRRNLGKVRGFTFNINSGAVESLELDPFGISIIPSNLVSTYSLLVEDVLDIVSDVVVVHEAAASHIQRLTKGFWDTRNAGTSLDELGEYFDFEKPIGSDRGRSIQRSSQKFRPRIQETEDDWELPMDYL